MHPHAFVQGAWRAPRAQARPLRRWNPANLRELVYDGHCAEDHVSDAVEGAARAQRAWGALCLEERLAALDAFAEAFREHERSLAMAIAREVGKPLGEALVEARALPSKWEVTRAAAPRELGRVEPAGVEGYYDWRPLGVFAVLGPFNFPMHLANGHILPALAAGNAVVLKPSEVAPHCATLYVEAWERACATSGMDPALLSLLPGDGVTGAALVDHPGVAGVAFTGSRRVGIALRQRLAARPDVLLALEMGGKNAVLVWEDAALDAAAEDIAFSAFATTGQRCTAASRVLVHPSVADAFLDRLLRAAERWCPGPPLAEETAMGPLATEAAYEHFVRAQGERAGLRTWLEGGRDGESLERSAVVRSERPPGYWVRPAIHEVLDLEAQPQRWQEELFGPELLMERVGGEEAMLERANATRYGLATSVYTGDPGRFERMRPGLRCGLVHHNRPTIGASALLPFGGWKESGNHRPAGALTFRYVVGAVATLRSP